MGSGIGTGNTLQHDLYETVADHFNVARNTLTPATRFADDLRADEHDMEEVQISFENKLSEQREDKKQVLYHDRFEQVATLGELEALVNSGRTIPPTLLKGDGQ